MSGPASASDARARRAAEHIWAAWSEGRLIGDLPPDARPRTPAEGDAAQTALVDLAGPLAGWKLAATSPAGQRHIQVTGALPGRLFARFRLEPGAPVPSEAMHMAVAEAEFCFRMGRDLPGPGPYAVADVLDAAAALHLAIELPDSRFRVFERAGEAQLLADDACAGRFLVGPAVEGWRDADLAATRVTVLRNGEPAGEGSGANVLGDPRAALRWLASELPRRGAGLRAGDVIMTGVTTVPVPVGPGDEVLATFAGLGRVGLRLAP